MPLAESILYIYRSTGNRTATDKVPSSASPLLGVQLVRRRRALATSNKIVEQALQRFLLTEN